MKDLLVALKAEQMKLKHSKIVWVTFVLFVFIPLIMVLLMLVAQHPEIADKLGIIKAKAQFFSENSWQGFLEMINQLIAVIGIIGFGFVSSWVFGREYLEHTLTDILALPVPRSYIVSAKYIIILIWSLALSVVMLLTSILFGLMIKIPDWDIQFIYSLSFKFLMISFYTILLSPIIGLIVSLSRGIVAPIGFVILMVIMAQFVALLGWGVYFPWAIPGIYAVSNSTNGFHLITASYFILAFTSLAGLFSTYAYWKYADH